MIFAWNINTLFTNPISATFFAVFLVFFIISIILLIVLAINSKLLQTIAKSIDMIETLRKSPLKGVIKRIAAINEGNDTFKVEFSIWRTKYEIIYEKKLINYISILAGLLDDKKNLKPKFSNIKKFQHLYTDLEELHSVVHNLYTEIFNDIEIEYVQRDYITYEKELFSRLKDEVTMLTFNYNDLDQEKLKELIDRIEGFFEEFYLLLDDGKFKKSWEHLTNIHGSLKFLIELLDAIPEVYSMNTVTIPEKLLELKNKYVTFGTSSKSRITRDAQKYKALELEIDNLRIKIKNEIINLQYKKANKTIEKLFEKIEDFKIEVEHSDLLKIYFENNIEDIRKSFDMVQKGSLEMEKAFNHYESPTKLLSKDRIGFEEARLGFIRTKEQFDLLVANIDINDSNGKDFDLLKIKDDLLKIMNNVLNDISKLEKSAKVINSKSVNLENFSNKVLQLQSFLSQAEIKIDQYKSIVELKDRFLGTIIEEQKSLDEFARSISMIKTIEQKEKAKQQLDQLTYQVFNVINELNDAIFLDYISQEIIVYLERYIEKYPQIQDVILQCEHLFQQRQLEQVVNVAIRALTNIKVARK
ncbi:septation ring formation regulator [Spiroplasma helicoides]|uniref:Septation ring formation regulator n=1 Tax=Spiroplasma helicoides TaxID=216938 RepID=A0A1B3SLE0_9MOLU|nr:septation ring formation regulator EzrA [Spiroplasma helicoides]AOG60749.1 septation ring formation regulator [Spiroplasma helicoides]